ncbi:FKBP-type peptidyl-prolyl cis-trans isomerase [Paenarthrobacter sp. Z7-10]|uniref:FKBP-type peptidyl-prolyl cis-trans isomerase n=1 Tax=Paenarthrobacter sp. Z7-10 TaxID=2787635 RepID=UPI0022A94E3F|nr:FKBP-type peptidyl-prolyl cis-trans isomerase [Paenarthrobacter sp. Z7-10]MCZ2404172.1 FKBP-type peptidyl-prolyl cis-trans isomerase [Paenarthrobacter sp. Z7-10]
MRRLLAIVIPVLLLMLTACSGGGSTAATSSSSSPSANVPASHAEDLASVKVKPAAKGKAPAVDFTKPLKISAESIRVITDGTGDPIKDGQSVVLREVAYNAENGSPLGDNYSQPAGQSFVFDSKFQQQYPLVYHTFIGTKVGAQVAYAVPGSAAVPAKAAVPSSSAAPSQPAQPSQPAVPAQLVIYEVESTKDAPKLMSQDDVAKLDKAGGLPAVKFDAKGAPSITVPKKDAPSDLVAKVLSEGKGDVVKATDTITANYSGWQWSDGKKFDSSYDKGKPITTPLSNVIPGWTQGLAGQKVGSKVLLVIPSVLAYGDSGANGQPSGPLVFVVEITAKK